MVRRQIYLTELQIKALAKEAKLLGITVSELIRRVLDRHVLPAKSAA
ncbi:MAG: ribbon-helix-helix protein, CopG family [Tepidisphaeraceae bacterium]